MAGLPAKVVERAQELLTQIEAESGCAPAVRERVTEPDEMVSLFRSSLADELVVLDVMTLTPLEALNILHRLTLQAKQEAGKI